MVRPVRLLHVCQPTTAGVARCVADLALAQHRLGLTVTVACPPGGALTRELRSAGVRVIDWPASRSPGPSVAGEVLRLRRVLREVSPDLVHLHSAKAGLVGRLAVRGRIPTAFSPHAWSFEAVEGPVRAATLAWERRAARWTTLLVCVSEQERRTGAELGICPPAVAVPNGVDLERLPPAGPLERARAREALDVEAGPLVVCVGRLTRQKGQDVLLDAWPQVLRAAPAARLALVGDGPDRAALAARDVAGVHLAGDSAQVPAWLAAADVVVVPSRWEGMALVPLEAMARARAVVVTDVTGVRESVPAAAGAIVPARDPAALAAALAERLVAGYDVDEQGRAGRRHVETAHDLRRTTAATTRACLALLPRSGDRPQEGSATVDHCA